MRTCSAWRGASQPRMPGRPYSGLAGMQTSNGDFVGLRFAEDRCVRCSCHDHAANGAKGLSLTIGWAGIRPSPDGDRRHR